MLVPGRAIKASASRAISALRSCMSDTVRTSPTVSPDICQFMHNVVPIESIFFFFNRQQNTTTFYTDFSPKQALLKISIHHTENFKNKEYVDIHFSLLEFALKEQL